MTVWTDPDISIHALREESDDKNRRMSRHYVISIHALREESDGVRRACDGQQFISIHALREESDSAEISPFSIASRFQSTLSVRRATITTVFCVAVWIFQSTLSVRRATGFHQSGVSCNVHFNPRSP